MYDLPINVSLIVRYLGVITSEYVSKTKYITYVYHNILPSIVMRLQVIHNNKNSSSLVVLKYKSSSYSIDNQEMRSSLTRCL